MTLPIESQEPVIKLEVLENEDTFNLDFQSPDLVLNIEIPKRFLTDYDKAQLRQLPQNYIRQINVSLPSREVVVYYTWYEIDNDVLTLVLPC